MATHNEAPSAPVLHVVAYEALIWVIPLSKKLSAHKQKKVAKIEPVKYGPADFVSDRTWAQFQTLLAGLVDTLPTSLTLPSLEWRWQKLANSLWVPLRDEGGYLSLLQKLHEMKGSPYVIFQMDAPVAPVPTTPAAPPQVASVFNCWTSSWY
jgi:hypothetical protein